MWLERGQDERSMWLGDILNRPGCELLGSQSTYAYADEHFIMSQANFDTQLWQHLEAQSGRPEFWDDIMYKCLPYREQLAIADAAAADAQVGCERPMASIIQLGGDISKTLELYWKLYDEARQRRTADDKAFS